MKKFAAGFATCWLFFKYSPKIVEVLENTVAKLQLKQDILKHDHPEVE